MTCKNGRCKEPLIDLPIINFFREDKWIGRGYECPICTARKYIADYRKNPRSKQVALELDMRKNDTKTKQVSQSEKPKETKTEQLERCENCGWQMPHRWIIDGLCGRCSRSS